MQPAMRSAHPINGILMICLLASISIFSLATVRDYMRKQDTGLEMFIDGQLMREFEAHFDQTFFLRDFAIRQWSNVQYLLFDEGTSGVILGKQGWLFSNQEYLWPQDFELAFEHQLDHISTVQQQLSRDGIRLILLPVPLKVGVYQQHLVSRPDSRILTLHDTFVDALKHRGIEVANIHADLNESSEQVPTFVRTDTHWTPEGARQAARSLARQYPDLISDVPFVSRPMGDVVHQGDLLNFINFAPELAPDFFAPVQLQAYETTQKVQAFDEQSLFGDQTPSLVLVGTSYSQMDLWNFPGFLKEALQQDLVTIALQAKGPNQAMQEFITSDLATSMTPHTLIWEYPVRTLLAERPFANRVAQKLHF